MSKINIFFADGLEEIEGLAVVDLVRRAKLDISIVSIMDTLEINGSHNIKIIADKMLEDVNFEDGDMIILPGGLKGTNTLAKCEELIKQIKEYNKKDKMLAAICAAPSVLGENGILEGKEATCYPGFEEKLLNAMLSTKKVVVSKNTITSRGMGTANDFGLAIVEHYKGKEFAMELARAVQYFDYK